MRLSNIARDRRGTLYEIPLLVMFLGVALAIGIGQHSWWKGPLYAALFFGGLFGLLVAFIAVSEKLDGFPLVRRVLDSRLLELLGAGFAYLMGVVGCGAIAAFASIFLAPALAQTPPGQLALMRGLTLFGALGGAALTYRIRRQPPRF